MDVEITKKPTEEYEVTVNGLEYEVRVEKSKVWKNSLSRLIITYMGTGDKYEIPESILEVIEVLKQHNII